MVALIFSATAEAGWLEDKLKQAAEKVGGRIIDDASDSAYEDAKQQSSEAMDSEKEADSEPYGQPEPEEAVQFQERTQGYPAFSDEPGKVGMDHPDWAATEYGQEKKQRKKGPPRTDLYLSTEMIIVDPESFPDPVKGNIYIDGGRMRTEWKYPENDIGMIVTGFDPADKVYILMHKEKTYMESNYGEADSFSFESGKPCDEFRQAEDLGRTKHYGRNVTRWRCSEPEDPEIYEETGGIITVLYDDKLKLPVRIEDGEGYWELVNIREGRPSGDHFKVPAGYEKFTITMPPGFGQ